MKTLNRFLNESAPIGKLEKVKATDSTIKQLVREGIEKHGNNADLNYIDVSEVTDMNRLFLGSYFDGDISDWDVSNVENMECMLAFSPKFNKPLNHWDVSNVTSMRGMFTSCYEFNQDLNNWDVSKVTDMKYMFTGCKKFNGNLDDWIVTITDKSEMESIFKYSPLENNPPKWHLT